MRKLLIHHSDNDGILSGVLMKLYYDKYFPDYDLFKYNYEYIDWDLEKYSTLIFCDCSPQKSWLEENIEKIKEIQIEIYDHHVSKYQDLMIYKDLIHSHNFMYFYDPDKSGCEIFYDMYVFPNINWEYLCKIIGAYDIFKFEKHLESCEFLNNLNITKEDIINFNAFMLTYDSVDKMEQFLTNELSSIFESNLLVFDDFFKKYADYGKYINKVLDTKQLRHIVENGSLIHYHYYDITVLLLNDDIFNVANQLSVVENVLDCKLDVVIGYKINHKTDLIQFSFRSFNEKIDMSLVAKHFGGGGHKSACGCLMEYNPLNIKKYIDSGNLIRIIAEKNNLYK